MSSPPGSSGRRRGATRQYSAEDQALDQIAKEAEARLASRRAARAEARDIRMRELEKQQQEAEEKNDRRYEKLNEQSQKNQTQQPRVHPGGSRRNSDSSSGSTEDGREIKRELSQLEERYKKAMMSNAQLDNEKQTYRFQVDLLKDQMEDLEEQLIEVQREHHDRCKELEHKKREYTDLRNECAFLKQQLQQRDDLITENGLVYVSNGTMEDGDASAGDMQKVNRVPAKETGLAALITPEAAEILGLAEGSLDDRLKVFAEEKKSSQAEIKKLRQQLDDERERITLSEKYSTPPSLSNGPDVQFMDMQMEAQKQLNDYKYKLKKAEQDITTLEGNVLRLESQVKRYRSAAEGSEKVEDDLKQEKRKLQRELREAQAQLEEFQTANYHLQKRIDKMKSGRNAYK